MTTHTPRQRLLKIRRQYNPPEYDDEALLKWLLKDKARAEAEAKEKMINEIAKDHLNK